MKTVVKFIKCSVDSKQKTQFSDAQESWSIISDQSGFLGQIGGWIEEEKDLNAYIFSFWENKTELKNFMEQTHDGVVAESKQNLTYRSIETHFFNIDDILAPATRSDVMITADISWIRFIEGFFYPSETKRVEEAQRAIWKSGTRDLNGFLGGYSSKYLADNFQFQLLSFWRTKDDLDNYSTNHAFSLRDKAKIDTFLKGVHTRQIECVQSWTVAPKKSRPI